MKLNREINNHHSIWARDLAMGVFEMSDLNDHLSLDMLVSLSDYMIANNTNHLKIQIYNLIDFEDLLLKKYEYSSYI